MEISRKLDLSPNHIETLHLQPEVGLRARTRRRTRQFFAFPPFLPPASHMTIKRRVFWKSWKVRVRVVAIIEVLARVLALMLVYLVFNLLAIVNISTYLFDFLHTVILYILSYTKSSQIVA